MLIHTELVSWHDSQLAVVPAWIAAAEGAGCIKPVPGPVALIATGDINPAGVESA